MPAAGLNGSYGTDTGQSPARKTADFSTGYGLASRLHYQDGVDAKKVLDMPDEEWNALSKGDTTLDRVKVSSLMRAYEHYQ